MKPAVRKLIEDHFQVLNDSHPYRKEEVQWEMRGYAMALHQLKLIDSLEYRKLYSDVSKIRTLHDRIVDTLDKIMHYSVLFLFVAIAYLGVFAIIYICIYCTMNAGTWLGF